MKALNLTAKTKEQELIKKYLEEHASDVLAEKINNGTPCEKNGVRLINKKDLEDFMRFAAKEAQQTVQKGANCACIEDSVVYGWAIHYFEEESIEGVLYNLDGTPYKPVIQEPATSTAKKVTPPQKQQTTAPQMSFDFGEYVPPADEDEDAEDDVTEETTENINTVTQSVTSEVNLTDDEIDDEDDEIGDDSEETLPIVNVETGEVFETDLSPNREVIAGAFEQSALEKLIRIFNNNAILR